MIDSKILFAYRKRLINVRLEYYLKIIILFITGVNGFYGTNNQISDWMVAPLVPMLVTPFVTRAIYKKTRNPYLGGIINAVIITIMTCVNAQIVFPA